MSDVNEEFKKLLLIVIKKIQENPELATAEMLRALNECAQATTSSIDLPQD